MDRPTTREEALALIADRSNYVTIEQDAENIRVVFGILNETPPDEMADVCQISLSGGLWWWSSSIDDDSSEEDRTCNGEHAGAWQTPGEALAKFIPHHVVLISQCAQCGQPSCLPAINEYIFEQVENALCETCWEEFSDEIRSGDSER